MKVMLPDFDFAREQGLTHQVSWQDPNEPPCFMRFKVEHVARTALDALENEGPSGRKIVFTDLRPLLYPKAQ